LVEFFWKKERKGQPCYILSSKHHSAATASASIWAFHS